MERNGYRPECNDSLYPSTGHDDVQNQTIMMWLASEQYLSSLNKIWRAQTPFQQNYLWEVLTKSRKDAISKYGWTRLGISCSTWSCSIIIEKWSLVANVKLAAYQSKGYIKTFHFPFWFFQWMSLNIDQNLQGIQGFTVIPTWKLWFSRNYWCLSHHAEYLELSFCRHSHLKSCWE